MIIRETNTEFRVIVTRRSHEQSYNPTTLNHLWSLVDRFKGQQDVKRIRVFSQLAEFVIEKD